MSLQTPEKGTETSEGTSCESEGLAAPSILPAKPQGVDRWLSELAQALRERLRQWLCKKRQQPGQGTARYPDAYLYDTMGLQRLSVRTHELPWAKA
jgi:hypothetical protein